MVFVGWFVISLFILFIELVWSVFFCLVCLSYLIINLFFLLFFCGILLFVIRVLLGLIISFCGCFFFGVMIWCSSGWIINSSSKSVIRNRILSFVNCMMLFCVNLNSLLFFVVLGVGGNVNCKLMIFMMLLCFLLKLMVDCIRMVIWFNVFCECGV